MIRAASATILCAMSFAGGEAAAAEGMIGRGVAAWYQSGHRTATGERFNPDGYTAAHRTLPLGSKVRVVNARSNRSVVVRINDRGPFGGRRIIDLSRGAARAIGLDGVGMVELHAAN